MGKRWRIHTHDIDRISELEQKAGVPPIVAQLLVGRGVYDPEQVRSFLNVKLTGLRDPDELPGLPDAADRIHSAIVQKRRIVIYGDYDADGMTSSSILFSCLRLLGADVGYYVPSRLEDGYGLNHKALKTLASRGASLIVTVDCGIASIAEAETAQQLGLELIITDHHEFAASLPAAAAIVHPRLPGHNYPFSGLCGAGVAFKLAWALCQRACQAKKVTDTMRDFLLTSIGLAAIGTIADVVPLIDENRIIVHHGLNSLFHQAPLGVTALKRVAKLDKKSSLTSEDVAFMLAPRLNAAGRLGQAQLGVELLTTQSAERATALAEYLHELNNSRVSLERSIYLAANKQIKEQFDADNDPAFVLSGRGWHAGVIGIVAGRLAEKFHRPVVLISQDDLAVKPGVGSARSAGVLNLHQALEHCSSHLVAHGGHAAAAGLTVEDKQIEAFRDEFCEYAAGEISENDRIAELHIDIEAPLSQLTLQTVRQIEQLAPFGAGNPRPVLCTTGVHLTEPPKRMGGGDRHLSLKIKQHQTALRAVGFGLGEAADELANLDVPMDIAYRPVINDFRGRKTVEMHLLDWRIAEKPAAVPGG